MHQAGRRVSEEASDVVPGRRVTPSPVRYDADTFPNAGRLKGY